MHLSPLEVARSERAPAPPTPSPEPPPRRPLRLLLSVGAVCLVLIFVVLTLSHRRSSSPAERGENSGSTTNSGFALRLTGTTEAVNMRSIVAPMLSGEHFGTLTITRIMGNGTRVRQGDLVAEFDRQTQMRDYIDKQAEYVNLMNKTAEAEAKEAADRARDETDIEQAETALSKAQLEMQKIELLSKIDAEKAEEALEEAKATLDQLHTTFDLKRQAAKAGIHLLEIQRDRAKQVMDHSQANAALMQIHAPIDGIVVLNTIWKQGKMGEVQEGDQIRPGIAFMQVVDPSQMQVRALVNQQDFLALHIGLPVSIRLDAYPELLFSGKLEEMAPIARNGDFSSKLRTFAVVFSIQGKDTRLMPDLSAAVDVGTSGQPGTGAGFNRKANHSR
jgi:HlyD family secretion protein